MKIRILSQLQATTQPVELKGVKEGRNEGKKVSSQEGKWEGREKG